MMTRPRSEATLENLISALSPERRALLKEIVEALSREVRANINPRSDICSPAFALEFQDRLTFYHARHDEPLNKKTFEYAFVKASRVAGRTAVIDDSPVNPGTDVIVDGTSYSLKTEASQGISRAHITISKLMEARWIRECRTGQDFIRGVKARVQEHLRQYERILMLRAFTITDPSRGFEYHLIEIPLDVLLQIASLKAGDFSPRTSNGSSHADVYKNEKKLFSLRLDGSVEKITISNLNAANCIFHGSWKLFLKDVNPLSETV